MDTSFSNTRESVKTAHQYDTHWSILTRAEQIQSIDSEPNVTIARYELRSPIAGRIADRGWTKPATAFAMLAVAIAFLITHIVPLGSATSLGLLVAAAILLDFGVAANLTLGQRAIFALGAEYRGRLNGLYMATFFAGGAIGSAIGGYAYAQGGWVMASWLGFALPILALIAFSTERAGHRRA